MVKVMESEMGVIVKVMESEMGGGGGRDASAPSYRWRGTRSHTGALALPRTAGAVLGRALSVLLPPGQSGRIAGER